MSCLRLGDPVKSMDGCAIRCGKRKYRHGKPVSELNSVGDVGNAGKKKPVLCVPRGIQPDGVRCLFAFVSGGCLSVIGGTKILLFLKVRVRFRMGSCFGAARTANPTQRRYLISPGSTNPGPHVQLGMLAHVVGVPLGLADVGHRGIIVLLLHAIVHAILVLRYAIGFLHAVQQGQGGFRTGLGLRDKERACEQTIKCCEWSKTNAIVSKTNDRDG